MSRLNLSEQMAIRENLGALPGPVRLVLIKDPSRCSSCQSLEEECRDIEMVSNRFRVDVLDLLSCDPTVLKYDVERAPALIVEGVAGGRIRFFGVPSGFEFADFLANLAAAAQGDLALRPETRHGFSNLEETRHVEVLIPPTALFSPPAAGVAQKLAFAYPQVRTDIIKIADFPDLLHRYGHDHVTHVLVNGREVSWDQISDAATADAILSSIH